MMIMMVVLRWVLDPNAILENKRKRQFVRTATTANFCITHTHKTVAERTVQMLCFLTLPRKLHLPVTLYWKAPEKFPSWFCAGNSSSQLYWYYCCWGRRKVLMKVGLGNFALLNAFSYCYGINQTFQMKTQQPCALRLLLSILHYCITLWLHT